jgi:hypothetical protein
MRGISAWALGILMVGCEDPAALKLASVDALSCSSQSSSCDDATKDIDDHTQEPEGEPSGMPKAPEEGTSDQDGESYAMKNRTFYRKHAVFHATSLATLTLDGEGSSAECVSRKKVVVDTEVKKDSRRVRKMERCHGFLMAKEVLSKNNGSCNAQEILIRELKKDLVSERRYLGLSEDCVCYYAREIKVSDQVEFIRKRFALPEVCGKSFDAWAKLN